MVCTFGDELELATHERIRALTLDRTSDGTLNALYSADGSLFIRPVKQTGRPRRIATGCAALDAVRHGSFLFVACAHSPQPAKAQEGYIELLRLHDSGGLLRTVTAHLIGEAHRGLSLARTGDALEMAFHDGRPGAFVVRHTRLGSLSDLEGTSLRPEDSSRLLSTTTLMAGAPSLRVVGDRRLIAWSEGIHDDRELTRFRGSIYLHRSKVHEAPSGPPERFADVIDPWAHPEIAPTGAIFFRDVRRPQRRPALFVQTHREAPAKRVGRAGESGADLLHCDDSTIAISPRAYGRHDFLVAIYLLDEQLQKQTAEQQVYERASQFRFAEGRCNSEDGTTIDLLIGERNRLDGGLARLHALPLLCERNEQ